MKLEMRTLKNIAAAAMTLAVVFGAASLKPVTANAAEASVSASIEEENSYISFQDEAYQNEFLRRVNNERAKAGLKPVQLGDSSHNNAAQERAKELASSYSYVRPNGQRDFTIFAENGIEDVSIGEDYMAGVSTPDAAVDQWMNIDFTRERILNADATTMSVGHYEGGIYNNYWVLIFSCPEQTIQFLWNIFLKKFTDEESQRFRIPQKVFAGRFLLSVQNGIGGQSEGMQSVLLRYRKPHFGRYKTNSCGKIGHLQTTVVHM